MDSKDRPGHSDDEDDYDNTDIVDDFEQSRAMFN